MIKSNSSQYNKPMYMLYPGEYFVCKQDVVLATVAGSCLVVCLFDKYRKMGGLGQFILPGVMGTGGLTKSQVAAYAVTQLEYLFGEFVKLGGDRKDLTAKVFGAASYAVNGRVDERVLLANVRFVHEFFSNEKIPVENLDISGDKRRKVVFFPKTGKTFRKLLSNNETSSEIIRMENEYIENAFKYIRKPETKVILFDN